MKSLKAVAMLLVLVAMAGAVLADTIAYVVEPDVIGNQDYPGPLGMDFNVNDSDIIVTQLGVFDSGTDGTLQSPLQARLYQRDDATNDGTLLATLDFPVDDPGTLIDGSLFKPLDAPLTLPAGFTGSIVADGFGPLQPNGNTHGGPAVHWSLDDGGGLISFVGKSRFGPANQPGTYPTTIDGGPENRYAAGTFIFSPAAP